jgi:hypothetical protein
MAKKRKTYFSPELEFLKPFFYYVGDLIPLDKITSVRGYKVPLTKNVQSYANITKHGQKYRITINLFENDYVAHKQYPKYVEMVLTDFAHELSHSVCWEHDSEHFKLMGQIIVKFADILKGLGIEKTDMKYTDLEGKDE